MRIEPVDPQSQDPALKPLFDAVRGRGAEPLNLHRTLAHAPELLGAYLNLAFTLRSAAVAPRGDRELIILRTAQLTGSDYVFAHHRGMGLAFGLTEAQVEAVEHWKASDRFSERQRAILAYADAMFAPGGVDDDVFAALARELSPREIVEMTLTASFYAATGHLSRALQIPVEPDVEESRYGRS